MGDPVLGSIIGAAGTIVGATVGAVLGRSDWLDAFLARGHIKDLAGTWQAIWSENNQQQKEQLRITQGRGMHIHGSITSDMYKGKPCGFEGIFTENRFLQILWFPAEECSKELIYDYGCYFLERTPTGQFEGKAVGFFYHLKRIETFDVTLTKVADNGPV